MGGVRSRALLSMLPTLTVLERSIRLLLRGRSVGDFNPAPAGRPRSLAGIVAALMALVAIAACTRPERAPLVQPLARVVSPAASTISEAPTLDVDALVRGEAGVRVPGLATPEYACEFYAPTAAHPALSVHVWRPRAAGTGAPVAIVSTDACWAPGEPFVKPHAGGLGAPRSMVVARMKRGAWRVAAPVGPSFERVGPVATVYGNWKDPGEVSGWEIYLHPPDGESFDLVDCTAARMPVAAWNTRTGLPLTRAELGDWFEYRLDRGDGGIFQLPHFQREPVLDPKAWSVKAHDSYHLARAYMRALGLWRAHQDPVARALILMYAEDARIAWTLGGKDPDQGSSWEPFSLRRRTLAAEKNPGRGGDIVRGVAWSLRLGVAALEVGAPNRAEWEAWVAAMLRYVRLVQMPSGAFYSASYGFGQDQDEPWLVFGLDRRKGECPSWQVPFLVRAVWEAQAEMPRVRELARAIVLDAEKLWGPRTPRVAGEDNAPAGLPRYLVTSVDGIPVAQITEGVGPARPYYDADAFAVFAAARAGAKRRPRRGRVLAMPGRRAAA